VWSPDDFLAVVYPSNKKSVTVTPEAPNMDRGAGGNWKELKAGLKAVTEKAKIKRAKLKPHVPKK